MTILRTEENQKIIDTIDLYRQRLTDRNVEGLLVLASETPPRGLRARRVPTTTMATPA